MRKNGVTLVETMIVIAIIGILASIIIPVATKARAERIRTISAPQGKLIAQPEVGTVYQKTVADPSASAVVAIPRDKYYTEGTLTLHRVLVRVNNQEIVDATNGTMFLRDSAGQDHIVVLIQQPPSGSDFNPQE